MLDALLLQSSSAFSSSILDFDILLINTSCMCLSLRNTVQSTQVDPFGHSATQASLLSGLLGFDSLFFGRADYQVPTFCQTKLSVSIVLWMLLECTCGCVFKRKDTISLLTSALRQAIYVSFLAVSVIADGCRLRGFHSNTAAQTIHGACRTWPSAASGRSLRCCGAGRAPSATLRTSSPATGPLARGAHGQSSLALAAFHALLSGNTILMSVHSMVCTCDACGAILRASASVARLSLPRRPPL